MRAVFVEAEIAAYVTTNPAEGRALQEALRQRLPAHTTTHHAALDWTAAPALAAALRARHRPADAAALLLLLTAVRRTEARLARWDEIDHAAGVWTVPADRMKTGTAHRVPLSAQAAAEVVARQRVRAAAVDSPYVFPSGRRPEPAAPVNATALRFAAHASPSPRRAAVMCPRCMAGLRPGLGV